MIKRSNSFCAIVFVAFVFHFMGSNALAADPLSLNSQELCEHVLTEEKHSTVEEPDAFFDFTDLKECMKRGPALALGKKKLGFILSQLLVNELFTVSTYLLSTDQNEEVDWKNMGVDMAVSAVASVVEPHFALGVGSFGVRYLKMSMFGTGKAAFEGVLFLTNPLTQEAQNREWTALERVIYSTVWSAGNSLIKMNLFQLLQCLPSSTLAMKTTSNGIQLGYRFGSSTLYFMLRNKLISSDAGKLKPDAPYERLR